MSPQLDRLTKASNHLMMSKHHQHEADKAVYLLVTSTYDRPDYTIAEIARFMHISRPTVYAMVKRGEIAVREEQLPGVGA
jgi:DNA-binding MarR family transcriptional regulator